MTDADIVARLRGFDTLKPDAWAICDEAADEITRLRADLAACEEQENAEWVKVIVERNQLRADLAAANARADDREFYLEQVEKAVDAVTAERDAARADLAAARALLKPFAKAADNFDTMPIKDPEGWFAYSGCISATSIKGSISVGDLRRARAMLKGDGNE